ncbi:hypothetical protein [Pseudomonas sp. PLMAX]|uniref:hypothetical protein n=1 Tax=Pseudomonas sp. PLMAX TaxID=2201998 RepID=UPI0038B7F2F9
MTNLVCTRNQTLLQPWVDKYFALNSGDPAVWAELYHAHHTEGLAAMWGETQARGYEPATVVIDWTATECRLTNRLVKRAIQTLLHLKDGRFNYIAENLHEVVDAHPNPFAVRAAMADLESLFSTENRLADTEEEGLVRSMAFP